ncbi:MAG: EamA family transporter [Actinomycetota bacterium]
MIYGLAAALGWGLADFTGAVGGRRIGSLPTVMVAQALSAIVMTGFMIAGGHDPSIMAPYAGFVVMNGLASGGAYLSHYRALQLGPVAVVSPIGATYAVVGVTLAVVVLGERPGPAAIVGGAITVIGVMLTSTDLAKVRAGTHTRPPGLPWAIVSAVLFGVGGFFLGYFAQEVGWVPGLWASRCAQLAMFTVLSVIRRREFDRLGWNVGLVLALASGAADLLGVVTYSIGASQGLLSIVLIASAVFPLIAVALSIGFLHERPVANQYLGIALVVAGLLVLGLA